MTSQSNDTVFNGSAGLAKFIRAASRAGLLMATSSALALVIVGGIAVQSGVLSGHMIEGPDATKDLIARVPAAAACASWDRAAGVAIGALANGDAAPAQIEDAKFRLRRARRNCMAGWVDLACGDYQAIVAGRLPPGDGHRHKLDASKSCAFGLPG